jgi:hypothetical protein
MAEPTLPFIAMEVRCELILTREKLARMYLRTDNPEILKVMGILHHAIESVKYLDENFL